VIDVRAGVDCYTRVHRRYYAIRERYWPIDGKNFSKIIVHRRVICCRNKPKPFITDNGTVASGSSELEAPFFVTEVDFAGPITTLVNRGCGRKTNKSYHYLFVLLQGQYI